jgi:hypothetical protein
MTIGIARRCHSAGGVKGRRRLDVSFSIGIHLWAGVPTSGILLFDGQVLIYMQISVEVSDDNLYNI